jgi:hypothetical protein
MLNLFRMVSIVLFIQKNGPVMKVGSFKFSTWYENEASSKSFLKKLRKFQRVLHKEAGMKFPFPDDMNGRKLQKYTTSFKEFRDVFNELGFPLVKARNELI